MRFASALFAAVAATGVASLLFVRQPPAALRSQSFLVLPADPDMTRRLNAKTAVARQLLVGELTVPQAAAAFRQIEVAFGPPEAPIPDGSDLPEAERYCRMAIRWAVAQAGQDSAGAGRRLTAELDAARADGGLRNWPDAP